MDQNSGYRTIPNLNHSINRSHAPHPINTSVLGQNSSSQFFSASQNPFEDLARQNHISKTSQVLSPEQLEFGTGDLNIRMEPLEYIPNFESVEELSDLQQSMIATNGKANFANIASSFSIAKKFTEKLKKSRISRNLEHSSTQMNFLSRGPTELPSTVDMNPPFARTRENSTKVTLKDHTLRKYDFVIKVAKALVTFGAATHRVQFQIEKISECLNINSYLFSFPGILLFSFGSDEFNSSTHLVRVSVAYNMGKLAQVNALCFDLTSKSISLDLAIDKLIEITTSNRKEGVLGHPYLQSPWFLMVAFPIQSFCLATVAFGTKLFESLIVCLLSEIVAFMVIMTKKYPDFLFLIDFSAAFVIGFVSRSLQYLFAPESGFGWSYGNGTCFNYLTVAIAGMNMLLPGLALTMSINELATRTMSSGILKLMSALFTSLMLGFGLSVGISLAFYNQMSLIPTPSSDCPISPNPLWSVLLFPILSICFNYFFEARLSQYPMMFVNSAVSFAVVTFIRNTLPNSGQLSTVIASFIVGLLGNYYSKNTKDIALAPILAGILLLLPGGLSVKSIVGFIGSSHLDGTVFLFQMLQIGMSITVGLFLSAFFIWPTPSDRNGI